MNAVAIKPACERVQQVGAVKRVIGRAVLLCGLAPVVEFEKFTGLHVARVDAGRRVADGGDLVANADRLQRFDGLRTGVDGGADFAQSRSGFENLRLHSEGLECAARSRGRQARRRRSLS